MSWKMLKFVIILNSNAAGGRKLNLINNVISLLKKNHQVELFETKLQEIYSGGS